MNIVTDNINIKNNKIIPFNLSQAKPIIHVNNPFNKYHIIVIVDYDASNRSTLLNYM